MQNDWSLKGTVLSGQLVSQTVMAKKGFNSNLIETYLQFSFSVNKPGQTAGRKGRQTRDQLSGLRGWAGSRQIIRATLLPVWHVTIWKDMRRFKQFFHNQSVNLQFKCRNYSDQEDLKLLKLSERNPRMFCIQHPVCSQWFLHPASATGVIVLTSRVCVSVTTLLLEWTDIETWILVWILELNSEEDARPTSLLIRMVALRHGVFSKRMHFFIIRSWPWHTCTWSTSLVFLIKCARAWQNVDVAW